MSNFHDLPARIEGAELPEPELLGIGSLDLREEVFGYTADQLRAERKRWADLVRDALGEQKPVAEVESWPDDFRRIAIVPLVSWDELPVGTKLYTSPPPVAALPEVPAGWISCEERMPPNDDQVLVWMHENGYVAMDSWFMYREDPTGMGGPTMEMGYVWREHDPGDISHWMPLPAAPTAPAQDQPPCANCTDSQQCAAYEAGVKATQRHQQVVAQDQPAPDLGARILALPLPEPAHTIIDQTGLPAQVWRRFQFLDFRRAAAALVSAGERK